MFCITCQTLHLTFHSDNKSIDWKNIKVIIVNFVQEKKGNKQTLYCYTSLDMNKLHKNVFFFKNRELTKHRR